MLSAMLQDLRYGARALRHRPGFALAAVVTIALGLGPATAMYSVVDKVLLSPLPYPEPGELVRIGSTFPGGQIGPIPGPLLQDWQRVGIAPFGPVAGLMNEEVEVPAEGGAPERLHAAMVSASLGSLMGLDLEHGRWFSESEDRKGVQRVAVLTHSVWQQRFGADADVVGREITLDGAPVVVIGVASQSFHPPTALGARRVDLWMPLMQAKQDLDVHDNWFLRVVARLPESAEPDAALRDLQARSDQLIESYPAEAWADTDFILQVASLHDLTVGSARETLTPLGLAVVMLLLTACVNLAHLNLARGRDRVAELALRGALGASRGRLVSQLLMENVLIGVAGAAAAIGLAALGLRLFLTYGPGNLPRLGEVALDLRVMATAAAMLFVAGLGFALLPAWSAVRGAGGGVAGGAGRSGPVTRRGRSVLVSVELALALVLLAGAGLLGSTYWSLINVDPGFRTDDVLAVNVTVRDRYSSPEERMAAFESIRGAIATAPGVADVGLAMGMPFGDIGVAGSVVVEGREIDPDAGPDFIGWGTADAGYFRVLGLQVGEGGRIPSEEEYDSGAFLALVNQTYVDRFLDGRSPLGTRFQVGRTGADAPWWEVAGVLPSHKQSRLDRDPFPQVYVPYRAAHSTFPTIEFLVRPSSPGSVTAAQLREAVWGFDPNQPIGWVSTLDARIADSVVAPRCHAGLLALLAGTGLALAAAGVFGTVAYAVRQRRREMAIRRALGATAGAVRRQVVGENLIWVVLGLGIGIVGAYPLSKTLESLLFGVEPTSLWILLPASLVLAFVAILAAYLPARDAGNVDPAVSLRH